MDYPETPHLRIPLQLRGGVLAAVEQDSPDEITQCVKTVLRCPAGFRDDIDDFGIEDPAFKEGGADIESLRAAIQRDEPRADPQFDSDLEGLVDTVIVDLTQRSLNA